MKNSILMKRIRTAERNNTAASNGASCLTAKAYAASGGEYVPKGSN
jgi:hypothetical protein